MTRKTNAIRILEAARVDFELHHYEIEHGDQLAARAASVLGMEPERIFKSLVVHGDRGGPFLALVPACTEIDLKRLAAASGNRRVEMVPQKEVRSLTGYPRGAVTPLGLRRALPVYIDETVELWPRVGVSGGAPGMEVILAPQDLLRLTGARTADIARSCEGERG